MKTAYFALKLETDVVFSKSSATEGGHSSLNYIPGAALLGYCASQIYNDLNLDAFNVFHSGKVKFSNAYPLSSDNNTTIPVPFSWHRPKNSDFHEKDVLLVNNIYNLIHDSKDIDKSQREKGIQPKQIREGFFSINGKYTSPPSRYRIKTAIDRDKGGRSKDEQLFGYESLFAGSKWYFSITFDDTISPEIIKMIIDLFSDSGFRLGRSRAAEYGQVKTQFINDTKMLDSNPILIDDLIIVYCLSDLALQNKSTGCLTLIPQEQYFKFDEIGVEFLPEKSFIRHRTYSPFNAKRKSYDLERQVIQKGSVICFIAKNTALNPEQLISIQKNLRQGVGLYQQDGLGQVLINPHFLEKERFYPENDSISLKVSKELDVANDEQDNSFLIGWLTEKSIERELEIRINQQMEKWTKLLTDAISKDRNNAPGKSQWSLLRTISINSRDIDDLRNRLFDKESGLCKSGVSSEKWDRHLNFENNESSYSEFLNNIVIDKFPAEITQELKDCTFDPERLFKLIVQKAVFMLGRQIPHSLNQRGNKDEH